MCILFPRSSERLEGSTGTGLPLNWGREQPNPGRVKCCETWLEQSGLLASGWRQFFNWRTVDPRVWSNRRGICEGSAFSTHPKSPTKLSPVKLTCLPFYGVCVMCFLENQTVYISFQRATSSVKQSSKTWQQGEVTN